MSLPHDVADSTCKKLGKYEFCLFSGVETSIQFDDNQFKHSPVLMYRFRG